MNFLQPWNVVWFLGFFVYTGIRHVYSERTKSAKKKGEIDTQEKVLLFFVFSTSLLPFLYLFTPWCAKTRPRPFSTGFSGFPAMGSFHGNRVS